MSIPIRLWFIITVQLNEATGEITEWRLAGPGWPELSWVTLLGHLRWWHSLSITRTWGFLSQITTALSGRNKRGWRMILASTYVYLPPSSVWVANQIIAVADPSSWLLKCKASNQWGYKGSRQRRKKKLMEIPFEGGSKNYCHFTFIIEMITKI